MARVLQWTDSVSSAAQVLLPDAGVDSHAKDHPSTLRRHMTDFW